MCDENQLKQLYTNYINEYSDFIHLYINPNSYITKDDLKNRNKVLEITSNLKSLNKNLKVCIKNSNKFLQNNIFKNEEIENYTNHSINSCISYYYGSVFYNYSNIFNSYIFFKRQLAELIKIYNIYKIDTFKIEGYIQTILNNISKLIQILILNKNVNFEQIISADDNIHQTRILSIIYHCMKHDPLIKIFTNIKSETFNNIISSDFKHLIIKFLLPYLSPLELYNYNKKYICLIKINI